MSKKIVYTNTYYIYKISHEKMSKIYIGYRRLPEGMTPETDGYMGSSVILVGRGKLKHKGLYDIYGKESFKKTILKVILNGDRLLAEKWEKYYIKNFKENGFELFNISDGGTGGNLGPEVRKLQSIARKGKSPWNKGMKYTQEQKIKYQYYKPKNYTFSDERSLKQSEALKKAYAEGRKKKGENKGFKYSEEAKVKMSKNWYSCRNKVPRKILNVTTGEIFLGKADLLRKYPKCGHYLEVIKGLRSHAGGFIFKFVE